MTTGQPGYIFAGWSPAVRPTVTENITYTAQWIRAPPAAEITSRNLRTSTGIGSYIAYVDVSVHNSGGPGTVVVWATVSQDGREWTKSQSMYLDARQSRNHTFSFQEVSFWGGSVSGRVWVENVR
ncbi:MAG: hypothetical protein LBE57_05045 [Methanosarcinales archaeon]|nr:hypothetical protein [Methanosarcinales archaeon]